MAPKRKPDAEGERAEPRRSSRNADSVSSSSATKEAQKEPAKKQKTGDEKATTQEAEKIEDTKEEEKSKKSGKIRVGDVLPEILLMDQSSNTVNLFEEAKTHGIVLFSYPAASTPGCTSQGCSYRDHYAEIQEKGYKVFGISTDTVNAQEKFKTKQGFQYPLLSDPKKELLSVLGGSTSAKKTALRCHWVFKKGGELRAAEINVKPKDCVAKALATIAEIEKDA